MTWTRRSVLKTAALSAACGAFGTLASDASEQSVAPPAPLADEGKQFRGLKIGVCSYSVRSFPAAEALRMIQRLGVRYLSLKEVHLPLTSSPEERRQFRQQAEQLGLQITSCGVIYLKNDESQMRSALDYVHDLGASVAVVGVSREMLPALDKVIKDYDLRAAIHNHGPNDKLFPSPLEVWEAIQPFHRKIGVCIDVGHTFRMHEDLVVDVKKTYERLYSMHLKDLDSGQIQAKGVPVGTGALPIIPLLGELVRSGYKNEVQLEYEVESKDPMPGMAESLGFMRGVLQTMA
jgi:sugar phosphate isomerase/epimerase